MESDVHYVDETSSHSSSSNFTKPFEQAQTPQSSINAKKTRPKPAKKCPNVRPLKRKSSSFLETSELGEALSKLEDISKGVQVDDEFDAFGKHVANQLRQLPLQTALQIQQDFQSTLTGERIKHLKSLESSSSYTWNWIGSPALSTSDSEMQIETLDLDLDSTISNIDNC